MHLAEALGNALGAPVADLRRIATAGRRRAGRLLVHAVLFGGGYGASAVAAMGRYT